MSNNPQPALDEQIKETAEVMEITESPEEIEKINQVVQLYAKTQIQRFDLAASDKAITELKNKYLVIQVNSLEDKAIAKQANAARLDVRRLRLAVTKLQEQILESPKDLVDQIKKRGKEIIEELKSIEDHLHQQEDRYKELKDQEQERRDEEERNRINMRNDILINLHMAFNGRGYSIEHLSIDNNQVADFSDQEFNDFVDTVKPISADFLRKKEIALRFDERKGKLRTIGFIDNGDGEWSFHEMIVGYDKIQECTGDEFDQIISDANVIADRVKREMAEFKANQERLKVALRQMKLTTLGMKITDDGSATHKIDFIDKSQIKSMTDDEFAEWCSDFKVSLAEFEMEKAVQARIDARVHELVEIGCSISQHSLDHEKDIFYIKGPIALNQTIEREEITSASEEEWKGIISTFKLAAEKKFEEQAIVERAEEQWNDIILEATAFQKAKTENELLWKQFIDKQKEKAAEERRTALLPDQKKLIEFSTKVAALWKEMPEMQTEEGKKIADLQLRALADLAHTIKVSAEAMS